MENHDHCPCPSGLVISFNEVVKGAVIISLAFAIVQFGIWVGDLFRSIGKAARGVQWGEVLLGFGLVVLCFIVVAAVFIHYYSLKEEKEPIKASRPIRRKYFTYRLKRHMATIHKRGNLSDLTIEDLLQDMKAHHPEDEQVTNPEMLKDYDKAFKTAKEWVISNN